MNSKSPSEYMYHAEDSAMSGYLYKKTRDDRWQKRWFETNGVYLTYYKSRKMEKLLAALSLPQVGEIKLVPPEEDPERQGGLFTLELNTRIYTLRAKSDQEAQLWVMTLNKLRVDGMNQGSSSMTSSDKPSMAAMELNTRPGASTDTPVTDWVKSGKYCMGCC
jgi:hypothetical protein